MDLNEFFAQIGGNLDIVLQRLPSEAMIRKFLKKFLDDPSYNSLMKALEDKNFNEAFMAAHTLKGTAYNLGLDSLGAAASELTETLRAADSIPQASLVSAVVSAYSCAVENIALLD